MGRADSCFVVGLRCALCAGGFERLEVEKRYQVLGHPGRFGGLPLTEHHARTRGCRVLLPPFHPISRSRVDISCWLFAQEVTQHVTMALRSIDQLANNWTVSQ